MSQIKQQLKETIESKMIPECKSYLDELNNIIGSKDSTEDDQDAINEMNGFMDELQGILHALKNDELTDEDAQIILNKLHELLEAHE